jgi:RHS repeat-associated protein
MQCRWLHGLGWGILIHSLSKRSQDKSMKSLLMSLVLLILLSMHNVSLAGEVVTYYYTDAQGTPLATTDAQGNVISTADYLPYGEQALGQPGPGPGYTGHVNDDDTGLVYMQARYYDPQSARFLSVDPSKPTAGDVFSQNRFAYAENAPLSHTDSTGKCVEDLCIGEAVLAFEGFEYLAAAFEADEAVAVTTEVSASVQVAATTGGSVASATSVLSQGAAQCVANAACSAVTATAAASATSNMISSIQQLPIAQLAKEHTKNARPSSKGKHEKGNARRDKDADGEKGDDSRRPPNKRPPGQKGPWPPKPDPTPPKNSN